MNTDTLLKPRYKVIADFYQNQKSIKDNQIKVGDLFMNYIPQQNIVWRRISNNKWEDITIHCPDQYPHLFRRLEWWEERQLNEMPEYVKEVDGKIHHVTFIEEYGFIWMQAVNGEVVSTWAVSEKVMCFFEPATQAEFEEYQNKKT
jgi:hypothetical protein